MRNNIKQIQRRRKQQDYSQTHSIGMKWNNIYPSYPLFSEALDLPRPLPFAWDFSAEDSCSEAAALEAVPAELSAFSAFSASVGTHPWVKNNRASLW